MDNLSTNQKAAAAATAAVGTLTTLYLLMGKKTSAPELNIEGRELFPPVSPEDEVIASREVQGCEVVVQKKIGEQNDDTTPDEPVVVVSAIGGDQQASETEPELVETVKQEAAAAVDVAAPQGGEEEQEEGRQEQHQQRNQDEEQPETEAADNSSPPPSGANSPSPSPNTEAKSASPQTLSPLTTSNKSGLDVAQMTDEELLEGKASREDLVPDQCERVEGARRQVAECQWDYEQNGLLVWAGVAEDAGRHEVMGNEHLERAALLNQWVLGPMQTRLQELRTVRNAVITEEYQPALKKQQQLDDEIQDITDELNRREEAELQSQRAAEAAILDAAEQREMLDEEAALRGQIEDDEKKQRTALRKRLVEATKAQLADDANSKKRRAKEAQSNAARQRKMDEQHSQQRMATMREALLGIRKLEQAEHLEWEDMLRDIDAFCDAEEQRRVDEGRAEALRSQRKEQLSQRLADQREENERQRQQQEERDRLRLEALAAAAEEERRRRQQGRNEEPEPSDPGPQEPASPSSPGRSNSRGQLSLTKKPSSCFGSSSNGRDSHIVDVSRRFQPGGFTTPRSSFRESGSPLQKTGSFTQTLSTQASFRSGTGRDAHWRDHTGKPNTKGVLANRK